MSVSRRDFLQYGAAGSLAAATGSGFAIDARPATNNASVEEVQTVFPAQVATDRTPNKVSQSPGDFDIRDHLNPRRLTIALWDQAYVVRHTAGGSFESYDRVLDEAVDRSYNTLRLDPMPQWIDLSKPDRVLEWADPHEPFMPWQWTAAVKSPAGKSMIDFVERLHKRSSLNYTLSAWWFFDPPASFPVALRRPANLMEGAEMWALQLTEWKRRFGLDRIIYVDIANETPYFFPDFQQRFKKETGAGWGDLPNFSPAQKAFLAKEINGSLHLLRREFPELRFTTSIHGDLRWLDVPVEMDCLDVHFYADADPRWTERTRFDEFENDHLFSTDRWFAEFSGRCSKTARSMAPMLRARQRSKMTEFADWAVRRGMPLTTSEGWASWYYFDSPKLDWGWLLEWSKWSVDDAIANRFWGWTPHNYTQPQFNNWKDRDWHRTLNERFLRS